ncbi:helix-turn-helix domain-containing protein [Streptomyces sp. cmx-4-9]|uniref:helix-turn-helix domain-containing protein n=1 Tax=Streptomyces sp. cmx-4-9 TaxID=2790941 RepID=UPI00398000DB
MAFEHPSATPRPSSRIPAGTPRSGVVHVNVRHADHYTVVGNHLAQHPRLSLVAIGLATHIQSLPEGAAVGIKALAERFPEGEVRIASALRELEAYGYLERRRVRLATGHVVTRTLSYNRPPGDGPEPPPPPPRPKRRTPAARADRAVTRERRPEPQPEPQPQSPPEPQPEMRPEPQADPQPPPQSPPQPPPQSPPQSAPQPQPPAPAESVPRAPSRFRPQPWGDDAAAASVHQDAVDLLARLRTDDPRLLLPEHHVRRLAPDVAAWLDRGAAPEAVRRLLAGDLPVDLRHPAGLIAHRLRTQMPPHLPPEPAEPQARRPDPFQTCDGCERAFRARLPGRCQDCPPETSAA